MIDSKVAVFIRRNRASIYHFRRDKAGSGMTVCGRLFDSVCIWAAARRAGMRCCKQCERWDLL